MPTHAFKAVLLNRRGTELEMLGFIMPNSNEGAKADFGDSLVSIDEIEKASGVDFFAFLPPDLQQKLEASPGNLPAVAPR